MFLSDDLHLQSHRQATNWWRFQPPKELLVKSPLCCRFGYSYSFFLPRFSRRWGFNNREVCVSRLDRCALPIILVIEKWGKIFRSFLVLQLSPSFFWDKETLLQVFHQTIIPTSVQSSTKIFKVEDNDVVLKGDHMRGIAGFERLLVQFGSTSFKCAALSQKLSQK